MKKALLMVLVVLLLGTALNGFAGGGQEPSKEKEYPLGTIPAEPITINMWMISGTGADWVNFSIDELKKSHPNIDLNMTIQSDEFIDTNVITTLATKPKDIDITFFWSGTRIHELVKNDSVLNLDAWFEHYGWNDKYQPGAYNTNFVPGFGFAAFNYGWYAFTPFYNKEIFNKVGVKPPATMPAFWSMCEKLKQAGYDEVMGTAGKDAWPLHLIWNQMIGRYMTSKDVAKINEYSTQPTRTAQDAEIFRSDGAVKTWQFMADMKSKGYFHRGVNSLDWMDANEHFASGKSAMLFGFIPFTFLDAVAQDPNFPVDYFVMPDTEISDGGLTIGYNDVFVIPENVAAIKKPVLAEFLNTMFTDQDCIESAIKNGINPSNKSVTTDVIARVSGNQSLGRFFKEMAGKPVLAIVDVWLSLPLIKEYYNDLMEVTEGTMPPKEAAQRMYELALEEVD
jgi:ABC-type glycerol-3-phosphate transport system substrate-binding protein